MAGSDPNASTEDKMRLLQHSPKHQRIVRRHRALLASGGFMLVFGVVWIYLICTLASESGWGLLLQSQTTNLNLVFVPCVEKLTYGAMFWICWILYHDPVLNPPPEELKKEEEEAKKTEHKRKGTKRIGKIEKDDNNGWGNESSHPLMIGGLNGASGRDRSWPRPGLDSDSESHSDSLLGWDRGSLEQSSDDVYRWPKPGRSTTSHSNSLAMRTDSARSSSSRKERSRTKKALQQA
ncbi:hypothetical protein OIO90_001487 [Microbotryomycetes sp. JL221]|nr:hypothetical protein OIO90_001487 [Microbotryomycetes sp. JL221]